MNNSQITSKNSNKQSDDHSEESESEKDVKTENNYEYLLNELKMKSTALAKASNLIEILQVELEVEKNSKKEAVEAAQENLHNIYRMEIRNLNNKIENLQIALEKKKASFVMSTEVSVNESLPRQDSRLLRRSCSKSLNRSVSKQNLNSKQRQRSIKIVSQCSLQSKMYRKMLLINSRWDNQFIEYFEELGKNQTSDIETIIRSIEQFDIQFEEVLNVRNKNSMVENRVSRVEQVLLSQNQVINEMRVYIEELQQIIKYSTEKISQLSEQKQTFGGTKWEQGQLHWVRKQIVQILQRWKRGQETRERKMCQQNKQLRQIVQEMIVLMNKKRESSTKSCGFRIS